MILDKQNLFSDDQAITASAASTNVIDIGGAGGTIPGTSTTIGTDKGPGEPLEVLCQVTGTFSTCTSVKVSVQTDSDEAFGTVATLLDTAAIGVSTLVAGYKFRIAIPRVGLSRYIRLYYTVAGSNAGAGSTITAGFTPALQQGMGN
jgi:hypothetical protein